MTIIRIFAALACMFLFGCASQPNSEQKAFASSEKIYLVSHNYRKLIDLYKDELKKEPDNIELKTKLIRTYLSFNDNDSARYYLNELIKNQSKPNPDLYYLDGLAYYQASDFSSAKESLEKALEIKNYQGESSHLTEDISGDIYNLKGIVEASQGDLKAAKSDFIQAKHYMYDDVKMANNLAVIDMLSDDYQSAYDRLMPFYLNGDGDDQLKANLAVSMAKLNKYEELKQLFSKKYDEQKIFELYQYLQQLETNSFDDFKVLK
ncbi:tetratricopeptide repeat protein [Vibrio neonatus]|uniref:tetratricopeptide repeat protein n=1 Tax=Vibrio neonatus TaxID=278860 RepID=UPI0021C2A222|nr:hypothetical protein [Vibrio neonatus]